MIKVQERVTRAIQKNAILDASNFQNLHGILEYFDLRELQDVIVNAALWMEFEIYFANKNILIGKFDQLAELRNSIRHSRSVTEVAKKEGEASIIWFQTIFNKHNVGPSKNSIEFDLSDFDEIKKASEDNDKAKGDNPKRDTGKYDVTVDGKSFLKQAKRNAIFLIVKNLYSNGVPPEKFAALLYGKSASIFFEVDGHHESEQFIQIASQSQTRNFDRDRWFCGDGELFYSNGKTFAFTKMWGVGWPEALNILTKEFPDSNIRFEVSRE